MLVAVLVLALFGLWSLPVVALLLAALIAGEVEGQSPGGRHPALRYECRVCGAHNWRPLKSATGTPKRSD